ncbi:hypothetical protein [Caulobacter sp. 17J80-11]|uniref:hypothetical protein n=1 Tax=Caulobacter sp. 17J80-11 TaxID=2763502 RepID=UPI001653E3EA|nr:hypothetical protein [Caulobacter sp. 17J80-11]MBC6983562.1 hypothetical protein [Caulobacter sp. 17J80-11]
MRYAIQFQYRPKGDTLPQILQVPFTFAPDIHPTLLPASGDHVMLGGKDPLLRYVESRIYMYSGEGDEQTCTINIVLTDSEMVGLSSLIARS